MTSTEKMLRKRYYKKIPIEVLEDELLLDKKKVTLLLSNHSVIHVSSSPANKSYSYISFKTMMDILDVC